MNITSRGACSLILSLESLMSFKNPCIQIFSILKMFTLRSMEEEQETTGVKDIKKPNKFRTKYLRWSTEKQMEVTRWRGSSCVILSLEEREVDLALICLNDSMIIIPRKSFRLTLCFQTAMMLLCSLTTVFCRSKDWHWMRIQWLCWTIKRLIELLWTDWNYCIQHLSKLTRLFRLSWQHQRLHWGTQGSWTMIW